MRKLHLILILLLTALSFSNAGISAHSGDKEMQKIFNNDDFQGCTIGNDLSCIVPEDLFDPSPFPRSNDIVLFHTTDIAGNPISSADLFSANKSTMIKIWSTTCTHCIGEIPELIKLNNEFKHKGAQVIGIVYDADETEEVKEAKEILTDYHVNYVNLLPNKEIWKIFRTQAFPSTFFVNEKGEILGEPVLGSKISEYKDLLSQYLKQTE